MRVLVTGAASHTARVLLPRLLAHPDVSGVVGLDLAPLPLAHPRLHALRMDMRSADLPRALEGIDAVVHLAFVVLARMLGPQRRDRALMRAINLEGSRNVFEACAAAGVRRVVYASSVAVYGAWPDNPCPITETQPRRPLPGFAYSEDKAALEDWLDGFERTRTAPGITRLRLHAIVGAHAQPLVNALATARVGVRLPRPDLPLQCLHEDDAAGALLDALFAHTTGIYNIAAPEPVPFAALPRRFNLPLPLHWVSRAHRVAWRFTGAWGDPGWIEGLRHPLVVSCERALRELGWQPRHSTAEALRLARRTRG